MTWEELIYQLSNIPKERRNEKAVFIAEGEDAWEIDAVDYNTSDADNPVTWEDLEGQSIFDNEADENIPPITLTP